MPANRGLGENCNYGLAELFAKLPRDKIFVMFDTSHGAGVMAWTVPSCGVRGSEFFGVGGVSRVFVRFACLRFWEVLLGSGHHHEPLPPAQRAIENDLVAGLDRDAASQAGR